MNKQLNYRQIIAQAIADEMREDPNVVLIGEDVGAAGGAFKCTAGLFEEFGSRRVRDTPISEQAIIGTAIGSAIRGLRPVAEIMFADFAGVCFDQIVNQAAKYRYMTNGQVKLPLTIRLSNGAGAGFGAQHSQSSENWFLNIPGLKIAVPGTVEDLYGLLRAAIRDDNPVLVFEHKNLFSLKGSLPAERDIVTLGKAALVRQGSDVTIVATQQMRHRAVEAATILHNIDGIEACIVDPRTLIPFDDDAVAESLRETAHLLVVQEGPEAGSWGASLIARVLESHWDLFDAPPMLVSAPDTPIPYAQNLEFEWLPSSEIIAHKVRKLVAY